MNVNKEQKKSYANRIIDDILSYTGLNQANFCEKIGVNQNFIYDIRTGKTTRITERNARKILAEYPNFSKIWLLTGEGEMLKPDNRTITANNGDNNGIIVQQGDGSNYNNHSDLTAHIAAQQLTIDKLTSTLAQQSAILAQQSEQISKLIDLLSQK